jgi:hypothetical protein
VLIETSTTREIERMDDPSQSIERIWARLSVGNLFMALTITLALYLSSKKFSLKICTAIRVRQLES